MIKIRLEYPYDNKPPKYKKGWILANEPFYLMCALWEYNHQKHRLNIEKISVPKVIPGYDFLEFLTVISQKNKNFIMPEVIYRDNV